MEEATAARDVTWHALPFSSHSELTNRPMFDAGLAVSKRLDARFGVTTIAAKMTDVPGHTRGIVAPLVDAGVKLLHIGVNASAPVLKAPTIFTWRNAAGQDLTVMVTGVNGDGVGGSQSFLETRG